MGKKGTLTQNGVHLEEHEYKTIKLLLENGFDVQLIPPLRMEGVRTPDITLQGMEWEIKSPIGGGKRTIMNTVQKAAHQSRNIIVDLRRCKLEQKEAIKELETHFSLSKRIRRMKIITDDEKILDFSK